MLTFRPFHARSLVSVGFNPPHIRWRFHPKRILRALVIVTLGIWFLSVPAYSQVVFNGPTDYDSGAPSGWAVAVTDVNGDGKLDIIVASYTSCSGNNCVQGQGTVGVLLGNGDGTFQPVVTYASGGHLAYSVAVADVNGDGKPDVVVTNVCVGGSTCPSGDVGVLLGNGDGTFQPAVAYPSGGYWPASVKVADVNGDGKPDLVVANVCGISQANCTDGPGNSVGVLLGNGDGTFQAAVMYASGGYSQSLAVADVNGDGKPDLIVTSDCGTSTCTNGIVGVLLGNGDGTFQTAVLYNSGDGFYPSSVVVADVNGDGKPDVLVANDCGSNNCTGAVGVLLGNGDGSFQAATQYASGGVYPYGLAVGDVSEDGKLDLVVTNSCISSNCTGTVGVLLGNGDGTFQSATNYPPGGDYPAGVAVADVNGDGKLDVVVANDCGSNGCETYPTDGFVGVLINTGLATSMRISSSVNPSIVGQSVTFTATVTSKNGSPTGVVTFSDGSTVLGTSGLGPSGIAALNTSLFVAGQHSITASYKGDGKFIPNSSPLTEKVNKAATKTSLSSALNPSLIGQSITFTATVNPAFGGTPTDTITFNQIGKGVLATETLSGGTASFTTSFSAAGTYKIYATYKGDANFVSSVSASVAQEVNEFPTSTVVTSNLNPSNFGQSVTFIATVTSSHGTPSGTITFRRGTTALGTMALTGNTASFSTSALSAGTNSINAVYSGDTNFATSTSPNLNQKVNKIASTTTLASSMNPSTLGQSVTFTATVTAASGTPTGTITFKSGSTTLGTATLSGGMATFATSTLPSGSNSIKASYGGSTNYLTSSSVALIQVVQ